MRRLAAFACSSIATVALGLSVALPLSFAQNANSKIEQSTQVFSTDFSHSESASSGSVTLTASWNDPQLGSPTTFHVEGTGGSGKYLFRMDAPSYSNPGEYAFESVADPSRGEWTQYTSEATSHDYEFTMTAPELITSDSLSWTKVQVFTIFVSMSISRSQIQTIRRLAT